MKRRFQGSCGILEGSLGLSQVNLYSLLLAYLWKKITLTYERIYNENEACMNHVSRCSSLREIGINGFFISTTSEDNNMNRSEKIIAVVMKAKNTLTSIDLSQSFPNLDNSFYEKIGEITQLTHLAVGGSKLGPGGISALASLTPPQKSNCWRISTID